MVWWCLTTLLMTVQEIRERIMDLGLVSRGAGGCIGGGHGGARGYGWCVWVLGGEDVLTVWRGAAGRSGLRSLVRKEDTQRVREWKV